MPSSLPSFYRRLTMLLIAIAVGLGFVSPGRVAGIRGHLLDVLKPGLDGLSTTTAHWQAATSRWAIDWTGFQKNENAAETKRLAAELEAAVLKTRQLEVRNAELHRQLDELEQIGSSPYPSRPGTPLVQVELLEAAVIGGRAHPLWQSDRIIDPGENAGLAENDLVLKAGGLSIDQGENSRLSEGDPVYAGRTVVGRLAHVGRAVSTIQRVTDENYRGYAQLVRKNEAGFSFGAEGVLEGRGEKLCRLRYVPGTEAVEVGDEVYTGDHDGSQPHPMYYGRVVRAELPPGEQEWTIWVQPAVEEFQAKAVTVLRTRIELARSLTN